MASHDGPVVQRVAVMVDDELPAQAPAGVVLEDLGEHRPHRLRLDVERPREHRGGRVHPEVVRRGYQHLDAPCGQILLDERAEQVGSVGVGGQGQVMAVLLYHRHRDEQRRVPGPGRLDLRPGHVGERARKDRVSGHVRAPLGRDGRLEERLQPVDGPGHVVAAAGPDLARPERRHALRGAEIVARQLAAAARAELSQ